MKAVLVSAFAVLPLFSVNAQTPVSPLPPSQAPKSPGVSPAVTYLMREYGISEGDAKERLAVQAEVMELSARINRENDPAFSAIYTEHEPVFKVVVAFADSRDRKAFLDSLSPRLRRYVQLKTVPKSRRQINADLEELAATFRAAGMPFGGGFNPKSGRYRIEVETQQAANRARDLIPPHLRGEVGVEVKPLPRPEAAPTGVEAGDWIAGGYPLYPVKTDAQCTFGFPVRFGTTQKKGIVTAGHCGKTAYEYYNHWITFSPPVSYHPVSDPGKYDYEIFETTGLTDGGGYEVYYNNISNVPQFASSGYLKIYAYVAFANQHVGDTMCKSGQQTGITCGQISDSNYIYNGVPGWILVAKKLPGDISAGGDSGGPWFFDPGTGTKAIASGIHSGGVDTATYTYGVYMPVDYIDDHDPTVKLVLTP